MRRFRPVVLLFGFGLLQVFLPQVWSPLGAVDWLLVYIVHRSLRSPFQHSVLLGAGGGLIQDGLSGGIVGLHAFSKTAVAALIASFGTFLVVRGALPQALVTGAAAALESVVVIAWQAMLGRPLSMGPIDIAFRAVATGVATVFVLALARHLGRRRQRRRTAGAKGGRL